MTVLIQKCLCFPAPPIPPRLPDCLCCPICPQPQNLLPLCLRLFLNLVAIISYFSPTFKLNVLVLEMGLTLNKSCSVTLSHHFLNEIDQQYVLSKYSILSCLLLDRFLEPTSRWVQCEPWFYTIEFGEHY